MIAAALLILLKLWLVAGQTILAVGHANHDDALFIDLARHILGGRWLGPYNEFTLAKGPMYPLFIAGVFLLGIPLFTAQHLLYAFACGVFTHAVRPVIVNAWIRLTLFAVLLFNPITYDMSTHSRVLRQHIIYSVVLIILAALTALYVGRAGKKRVMAIWAVILGIALPAFWLTREEGIWLLPAIVLLWAGCVALVLRNADRDRTARLLLLFAPMAMWTAGHCIVSAINYRYYGLFTTCEFRRTEFKDAFGALLRIEPENYHPYLPITRATRESAYEVSPTFSQLRPILEGPTGEAWAGIAEFVTHRPPAEREIAVGWLMWAIRGAVVETGHGRTGAEAMAFYSSMAGEINAACDRGALQCSERRSGFLPRLRHEHYRSFAASLPKTARYFLRYADVTAVLTSASSGSPAQLTRFYELTRGRLSPPESGPPIPKRQAWLDSSRVHLLEGIARVYAVLTPWLVSLSIAALAVATVFCVLRRRVPFLVILSAGLLGSNLGLIAIVSLIDATSFPSLNTGYFTGGYALWSLLIFAAPLALAEAARPTMASEGPHP